MATYFDEMADCAAEIADTFGECLRWTPVDRKPNFQPLPQPEHAIDYLGVFSYRSKTLIRQNAGDSISAEPWVETRVPIASFPTASLRYVIQRGDHIERACDGSQFEVTAVKPDGVSMTVVDLVQLGRSNAGV